ncbi:MAG TPA: BON domain-containing protein [Methylomirabilota bacterium]|nr:BON domain-containing protein [Methylomirabilota bacterium]
MKRLTAVAAILIIASVSTGCQTLTGKTPRQHFNDKWLNHETKARIAADNPRALTAVNVDVNRGTVYLTGNVATPEQKARAEQVARRVDGVRDVVNHLEVETESRRSTAASPSASPASGAVVQHTVTGQVTSVDRATGRLTLRNGARDLVLQLPPAALQDVKEGDRLTVRLALSPAR